MFWLHLLAAPMIVHPVFTLLGLNDGNATLREGLVVILISLPARENWNSLTDVELRVVASLTAKLWLG